MPRTFLLAALLASGCLPAPPGYDFDGDGWSWPEDCDDDDASVHPDAIETFYDGVDQDCDAASDYDKDGDGYDNADFGGDDCDDAEAAVHPGAQEVYYDGVDQDCDAASDYDEDGDGYDDARHQGDDCDDTDAAVNPGAEEIWYDGVDQDCDGGSDYDQDQDGYDCQPGVSPDCPEAAAGFDCDDRVSAVYPGARETLDEVDEDCDGTVDEVPWGGGPKDVGSYHAGLQGEGRPYYGLGYTCSLTSADVAGMADLDDEDLQVSGDGAPDFLVSAPLGGFFGGTYGLVDQAVYLVAGGPTSEMAGEEILGRAVLRLAPDAQDVIFGAQLDWVPSVDGDSLPEILVGAPSEGTGTGEGHAYLFRSTRWGQATLEPTEDGQVHVIEAGTDALVFESDGGADDGFGQVVSMGDWDGSTGGEIAVTAPQAGSGTEDGYGWVERGKIFVFRSAVTGATTRSLLGTDDADTVIVGDPEHQHLGAAAPVMADLDGDGRPDLVVSTPSTVDGFGMVGALPGSVALGVDPLFADLQYLVAGAATAAALGQRLAGGGDLDGDGYQDVVAMASRDSGAPVLQVIGGGQWTAGPTEDLIEARLFEVEGLSIPTGLETVAFDLRADFNGDGHADLVVGSPQGELELGGGMVAIFYGRPDLSGTWSTQDADARIAGGKSDWVGYSCVVGEDVTGDGLPELLAGAPAYDPDGDLNPLRAGALYLLDPDLVW